MPNKRRNVNEDRKKSRKAPETIFASFSVGVILLKPSSNFLQIAQSPRGDVANSLIPHGSGAVGARTVDISSW